MANKAGCLQRLAGIGLIFFGVILLFIFILDDITIIGIIDNIVPIFIIITGVMLAFPGVKLPKFR